jgi:hypothetical protein
VPVGCQADDPASGLSEEFQVDLMHENEMLGPAKPSPTDISRQNPRPGGTGPIIIKRNGATTINK